MIDAAAMAPVFQRALGEERGLPHVQAHCLRYKPGTNLVVHYLVGVDGEGPSGPAERETQWHHATAMIARNRNLAKRAAALQNQALACQIDGRCPAAWPLYHDEEVGALVQWLPLDIKLPALALRPPALREALRAAGVDVAAAADPAIVAYRPRRRAVVRLGDHVLKVYADQADLDRSVRGLESGREVMDVCTPTMEAVLSELRVTVQAALPGVPVRSARGVAEEAGRLIAALHACPIDGVEVLPPANQLDRTARSANLAAVVAPNLAPRLRQLLSVLEELRPDGLPMARAHGDFHAGQLLADDGLVLIDLDEACAAPPALDVANYAAHLVRGAGSDSDAARDCLEALVDGYGTRPDGLAWYTATAVLRRAPFPFRFLDERWPEGIVAQVDAAEAALRW